MTYWAYVHPGAQPPRSWAPWACLLFLLVADESRLMPIVTVGELKKHLKQLYQDAQHEDWAGWRRRWPAWRWQTLPQPAQILRLAYRGWRAA
jgi:hypothetical protein